MCERLASAVPITVAQELAGYLVHDTARLRFVAASHRFEMLDGSRFLRPRDAKRAALRLARVLRRDPEQAERGLTGITDQHSPAPAGSTRPDAGPE